MPSVQCTIVELCAFKRSSKGPRFLILKRSSTEKLYPNMWQIITGKVKRAEKPVHAALRELREETGLSARRFWVAPMVDSFYDPLGNTVEMCPVFAAEVSTSAEPTLSGEHQAYAWATSRRATDLLVWPKHIEAVRMVRDYIIAGREASRLTEIRLADLERKKS